MNHGIYQNLTIILTSKHRKAEAIAPPLQQELGVSLLELALDTDALGTFSGEIERIGTAIECAKLKCEWGLREHDGQLGIASEGSFGPHPSLPYLKADLELLLFMDLIRGFQLEIMHVSTQTNYAMKSIRDFEELEEFARDSKFPSHALIVRPNQWNDPSILYKGIQTIEALEEAFRISRNHSADRRVWVETDMRAHYNPTRMQVIREASQKLATRLATTCPQCYNPGWGSTRIERGLPCGWCQTPTELARYEVWCCPKCHFEQRNPRSDGRTTADPGNCPRCNP